MFLESLIKFNKPLVDTAFDLAKQGKVYPDSYIIDLDMLEKNAKAILSKCQERNIRPLYILKQLGRNPYIGKELEKLGFEGAVCVDYKEALIYKQNNLHLSHVGHLVQTPKSVLKELMIYGVDIFSVFSYEKAYQINEIAKQLNIKQAIMLKVYDTDSLFYDGQQGGFEYSNVPEVVKEINKLSNVYIDGVTSFPTMLFNTKSNEFELTPNYYTVIKTVNYLKEIGINVKHINTPSANCYDSIDYLKESNEIEPGHGLTGTTPYHKNNVTVEKPCYIYVSEVSHNFKDKAFFYGGGFYRRGHFEKALVEGYANPVKVECPTLDNIDYYFKLDGNFEVGKTVVGCFRTQMFTTRSTIVLVKGISKNKIEIVGKYDSLGRKYNE